MSLVVENRWMKLTSGTKKFVAAGDSRVTECPNHVMAVISDIVKAAITKHSIRATSKQVGVLVTTTESKYEYNHGR